MVSISEKDEQLIALLRLNAREPVSALARKLGQSRTTVQDRLRRLEQQGIIAGYQLRLSDRGDMAGLRAFVTIEVEPRRVNEVAMTLQTFPRIEALYSVSGKYDLIALVRTDSPQDIEQLLERIAAVSGVTGTESSVILSTKLDRR